MQLLHCQPQLRHRSCRLSLLEIAVLAKILHAAAVQRMRPHCVALLRPGGVFECFLEITFASFEAPAEMVAGIHNAVVMAHDDGRKFVYREVWGKGDSMTGDSTIYRLSPVLFRLFDLSKASIVIFYLWWFQVSCETAILPCFFVFKLISEGFLCLLSSSRN